jgi:polyphosphate glucokinase
MPGSEQKITFAIDIGGTGVKGMLLDDRGRPLTDRIRFDTPNPALPAAVLKLIDTIAAQIGKYDRISVGFPGVVKHGATLTAHNLHPRWIGLDFQRVLEQRFHKPVRVANDAAVQGFGAIRGKGVELVITLGTGFGSSLFTNGHLVPGLELAHHPWRKDRTYEDYFGRKGFQKYGRKKWNKHLEQAIKQLSDLFNFDHLYIGGGNAIKIDFALPNHITRVPNEDGLLGGVALWADDQIAAATSRRKANAG